MDILRASKIPVSSPNPAYTDEMRTAPRPISIRRRSFLRIGGLGFGGLSFSDLLRAESGNSTSPSKEGSVVMVYLPGGPTQQRNL